MRFENARGRVVRANHRTSKDATKPEETETAVSSLRLHVICVILTLLAAYIFTLTEHDDHQHTLWCVFEIAMQTVLVVVATIYFRMRVSLLHQSTVLTPMLVMISCLSLLCEPIQRLLFGTGHAFEMLVMHSQCNLMLALAVCGFRLTFQRLAVLIAIFTTIFCCTISNAVGLIPLTLLFAVVAIAWLVVSWWETVDRRMLQTERRGLPWGWVSAAALVPLTIIAAGSFGSNSVTTALQGFMPSSGGTGEYDPFSRGGVNDGDALIAGNENIKSFAPLDDAPFLDSEKPSLYDVFNDTFDEPPRKIKKQERAVALSAELLKHIHQTMAEAKQAGREFSLLRSEKKADERRIRDLQTHALFYVAGRTPVHLKTEVYDVFDGIAWAPSTTDAVERMEMRETDGRHWLSVPVYGKGFEIFNGTATHSLKVANLDGNVIPSPAHKVGVSIDLVERADMYTAYENGLVKLNRESVPAMTPISVVSRCVERERLNDSDRISILKRKNARSADDIHFALPEGPQIDRIRALAEKVTEGTERGWVQISKVEEYLRSTYELDRDATIVDEDTLPLQEFLFETKRGPEYLFASSAAVMLRSLGYSARLIGGFYARPDKYDDRKQHTAVHAEDAHFWCEVSIGSNTWLTIEATPGYELLQPPPGLLQRMWQLVHSLWLVVVANAVLLAATTALLILTYVKRRSLQSLMLTLRWKLTSRELADRRAIRLASLVDHRLRLAGMERSVGTTLKRWATRAELKPVRDDLLRVAEIADRAMYSGTLNEVEPEELDRLATGLSFRQLQQLRQEASSTTTKSQAV